MDELTNGGRAAELDAMNDHQAITSLEREFPGWMVWRDTSRLCCARQREEPHALVCGEDWPDLRDELIRHIWRSAE